MTQETPAILFETKPTERLVVAVSSRALFALEDGHRVYACLLYTSPLALVES